ncbi:outer membrane lipoprotein [Ramlibacter aquaticus]|uniref:glycine zipper 2TM domain-containing protein n=1 Tax=Ramlibacter aquaticus TaxID=2780094 RepID=UPI00389AB08A
MAGGLLGHQMGGGNGKAALTVLGALGGAFAGNEVEKTARATTEYEVQVRMEDGSVRTVRQSQPIAAGTHVRVNNGSLSVASN